MIELEDKRRIEGIKGKRTGWLPKFDINQRRTKLLVPLLVTGNVMMAKPRSTQISLQATPY